MGTKSQRKGRNAERDAQRFGDGAPAVFFRRSREPWRVVMGLEGWMGLYSRATSCKCGGHCSSAKTAENRRSERGDNS